jgi:hypothetical protein
MVCIVHRASRLFAADVDYMMTKACRLDLEALSAWQPASAAKSSGNKENSDGCVDDSVAAGVNDSFNSATSKTCAQGTTPDESRKMLIGPASFVEAILRITALSSSLLGLPLTLLYVGHVWLWLPSPLPQPPATTTTTTHSRVHTVMSPMTGRGLTAMSPSQVRVVCHGQAQSTGRQRIVVEERCSHPGDAGTALRLCDCAPRPVVFHTRQLSFYAACVTLRQTMFGAHRSTLLSIFEHYSLKYSTRKSIIGGQHTRTHALVTQWALHPRFARHLCHAADCGETGIMQAAIASHPTRPQRQRQDVQRGVRHSVLSRSLSPAPATATAVGTPPGGHRTSTSSVYSVVSHGGGGTSAVGHRASVATVDAGDRRRSTAHGRDASLDESTFDSTAAVASSSTVSAVSVGESGMLGNRLTLSYAGWCALVSDLALVQLPRFAAHILRLAPLLMLTMYAVCATD